MRNQLTARLLHDLLMGNGVRQRVALIDLGVYYPIQTADGSNPFAIAHANPGQSVAAVIKSPQPKEAKVTYLPSANCCTRPSSQTTDFWNDAAPQLSTLSAAPAQDDEDPSDLGDENEIHQDTEPTEYPGKLFITVEDSDIEVLSFKTTSPNSDQPAFAALLPTGNIDPYDKSNHQKLVDRNSSVEAKIRKSDCNKTGRTEENASEKTANTDDEPDSDIIGSRSVNYPCVPDYESEYAVLSDFYVRNFDQLEYRLHRRRPDLDYETRRDVVQVAFITIWCKRNTIGTWPKAIDEYKRGDSRWLMNMVLKKACYLAIDRMRKKENKLTRHSKDATIEGQDNEFLIAASLNSQEPTTHNRVQDEECIRVLHDAIAQLSEANRVAIFLFYFQGMSYQECGDCIGRTKHAFKSQLHRARRELLEIINALPEGKSSVLIADDA